MHRLTARSIVFVLFETMLIVAAVWAAAYVRLGSFLMQETARRDAIIAILLIVGAVQLSLYSTGLYDSTIVSDRRSLVIRVLLALGAASIALAVVYYFAPDLIVGRGVFAIAAVFIFPVVLGSRLLFNAVKSRSTLVGSM